MDTRVARSTFAIARENGIGLVSAGLAFFMFNSLVPLLVFFIIAITTFGWMESLLTVADPVFVSDADAAIDMMENVLSEGTGRRRAALIAAVILGWSAFTMFQSVNRAFGFVYEVQAERSIVDTVVDTCLLFATVVIAAIFVVTVHVALTIVMGPTAATLTSLPLVLGTVFGSFVPMFYLFAPPAVTLREVLPGAALTAVSWALCAIGFRVYLPASESVELYGAAGGVMLLLTDS